MQLGCGRKAPRPRPGLGRLLEQCWLVPMPCADGEGAAGLWWGAQEGGRDESPAACPLRTASSGCCLGDDVWKGPGEEGSRSPGDRQPDLLGGIPAHGRGSALDSLQGPFQPDPFCDSVRHCMRCK